MDRSACIIIVLVVLALLVTCCVVGAAVALFAYGAAGADGWAEKQETIVSEVSVEAPGSLQVRNPVGDVTIRTGPEPDRVVVQATKQGSSLRRRWAENVVEEIEVRVVPEGSEVRVHVVLPESSGLRTARVDLLITVPEVTDLDVVNDAGHVSITGVEGSVRVRSATGALRMVDVTLVGDCDVMNVTGDITFEGRLPQPGSGEPWRALLRTETGDIQFLVPPDSQFTLDAESETGTVGSKFELQGAQSGRGQGDVGRWLKGGVNMEPGAREVVLRTETGNVVVAPLE